MKLMVLREEGRLASRRRCAYEPSARAGAGGCAGHVGSRMRALELVGICLQILGVPIPGLLAYPSQGDMKGCRGYPALS